MFNSHVARKTSLHRVDELPDKTGRADCPRARPSDRDMPRCSWTRQPDHALAEVGNPGALSVTPGRVCWSMSHVIGPGVSSVGLRGSTPNVLILPIVVFTHKSVM
jgi:hypothetical protein